MIYKILFSVLVTLKKKLGYKCIALCKKCRNIHINETLVIYSLNMIFFPLSRRSSLKIVSFFSVELHKMYEFLIYLKLTLIIFSI